jgi:hypothetical protein
MEINFRNTLITGAAVALLSIGIILSKKMHFSAKGEAILFLKTIPEGVQLKLDNRALFDGQYTSTPLEISINRGRHVLKIVRMGYESQIIKLEVVTGEPIRMENVVLGESKSFTKASAKIRSSGINESVTADIDRGFINEAVPFIADNLEAEQVHTIIFTIGDGSEKRVHSCTFQISPDLTVPLELNLTLKKSGFEVAGCEATAK